MKRAKKSCTIGILGVLLSDSLVIVRVDRLRKLEHDGICITQLSVRHLGKN